MGFAMIMCALLNDCIVNFYDLTSMITILQLLVANADMALLCKNLVSSVFLLLSCTVRCFLLCFNAISI